MGHAELLLPTNRFLDMCRNPGTVFGEISIVKPLDKFSKIRHYWKDFVVRSGMEGVAKYSEHEFLVYFGVSKSRGCAFPYPETSEVLLGCCDKWSDHAIAIQSNPLKSESVNPRGCSSWKCSHERISSSPLSRVLDSTFPRGLSSGRCDKVGKTSAKARRHSTESASNPPTNVSSIFYPVSS
jgi:hypothetical protein